MRGTAGTNLLTGAAGHYSVSPNAYQPAARRGVLALAALGGSADDLLGTSSCWPLIRDYDFPVAACDVNQDWGNATQRTRVESLRSNAVSAFGFRNAPVHLIGLSMGTCAATMYAANNPTLVRSLSLILPAVNIQEIYDDNLLNDGRASLTAAYGGRPSNAETPAYSSNTAVLSKIPMRVYYSQDDPICTVASSEAFIAATGAEAVDWGTLGYGFPVGHGIHIDYQDGVEFAEWIARND